jgi:Flp pilus assembly protein TadG
MLTVILHRLKRTARGNVAVEFALITALFVLPLLLGASDFVSIIAAQAQLNTALQALYYYAATNQSVGTTTNTSAILSAINSNSDFQLTLSSQTTSYMCYSTAATAPTFTANANANCGSGNTAMTFANYTLTTNVSLPIKLPGIANPLPLSASGSVQVN